MAHHRSPLSSHTVVSLPALLGAGLLALSTLTPLSAQAVDWGRLANSAGMAVKAATLSDAEVIDLANRSCAAMDAGNPVAPAGSKYAKRLAAALKPLNMNKFNGKRLDAKVYLVSDVNAFAMDNGCIRVFAA